ncbi:MAG: hypothetical protein LBG43_09440 [Treponema sp.]|jgi:hypothetical protein|nr:hypothetical protein [Treponema sp.]
MQGGEGGKEMSLRGLFNSESGLGRRRCPLARVADAFVSLRCAEGCGLSMAEGFRRWGSRWRRPGGPGHEVCESGERALWIASL